jgi:GH25 family lysozyme M1 (1,4-beta-N-acetylmuramidase)
VTTIQGADLFQKYNTVTNWATVKKQCGFLMVKLSNGPSKASPAGDSYVLSAKSIGLPVGGYGYALGTSSPAANAVALAAEVKRLSAFGLAPALDYEDNNLPTSALASRLWITQFFTALKQIIPNLTVALLYASGALMKTINPATLSIPGLLILPWDAEYGVNDGKQHSRTHYTADVAIHQYTSVGSVEGIGGAVDLNTLYDTRVLSPLEDDVTAADIWNYPLPNPNYPTSGPPTYTAAELLAGTYGTELAVDQHVGATQVAMLSAITKAETAVNLTDAQVAEISAPITEALAGLPTAVKQAIGKALTA